MTDMNYTNQYLTGYVNNQYIGIAVPLIQDVIGPHELTRIPLSHGAIAGVLNLRGRIVTVIDMHHRLREGDQRPQKGMGIIIEWHDELFSLLIDKVEDVTTIAPAKIEKLPPTLNPIWQSVSSGVYPTPDRIMILLDIEKILDIDQSRAA